MEEKALTPRGTTAPITKKQAMYLLTTIWPNVPEAEIVKAALLCQQYNLNPLMKQIYIIPFKAKGGGENFVTVLGIGASRAIAQAKGFKYSYNDGPRVMTDEEQVTAFGEVDARFIWAITVLVDRDGNRYPGYGNWPKDTDVYGSDKGNSKLNMAFIRSERNALDRMAPGTLPDVDMYDESYTPVVPAQAIAEGEAQWREKVNEDIDDLWPVDDEDKPGIDMVWLKEAIEDIRERKPLEWRQLGAILKGMMPPGREVKRWSEAVSLLSNEDARKFIQAVQRAVGS